MACSESKEEQVECLPLKARVVLAQRNPEQSEEHLM
jgi:hypothetical protein